MVDRDRSGAISATELQSALSQGGWKSFQMRTVKLMIAIFDHDRNGTIGPAEFGNLWKYLGDWKRSFDGFDRDRSGSIDMGELQTALTSFGYRFSPGFYTMLMRTYDADRSGNIAFDEFIQVCCELNMLTGQFRRYDTNGTGTITIPYETFLNMAFSMRV